MYSSIGVYDWQTILALLEALAWTAVVGIGLSVVIRTKGVPLTKQLRQIILVIFTVWAVANIGLAGLQAYSYFHVNRPNIEQQLKYQKQK